MLGFVVDGGDPAAGVVACAGLPGCASGHADTQADGAAVVEALRASSGSARRSVHVSGCAKRCASRRPHDLTLIAEPGGYAVALADPTAPGRERLVASGLPLADALAAAGLPDPARHPAPTPGRPVLRTPTPTTEGS
jgi:precorrin-3B synthase